MRLPFAVRYKEVKHATLHSLCLRAQPTGLGLGKGFTRLSGLCAERYNVVPLADYYAFS